jgi:O-antigen/teichoic acid export membrane protein
MLNSSIFGSNLIKKIESFTKTDITYFLKGGFWINSNYIAGSVISLLLSILFAHFVSKDVFGIYKYIISMVTIAAAFSLTGMNVAVMRAIAQGFDGIFKRSIIEQLKWSWPQFLFVVSFSIYYFYQGNTIYGLSFLIISFLAPFSSIANTYNAVLTGKKDFRTSAIYGFLSNIVYFVAMAIIILWFPGSALLLSIGYYSATTLINIYFCRKLYKKYSAAQRSDYRQEDISYARHTSVMNIIGTLANQLDSVLIYHLLGPAFLALYSFATIIPERIRALFGFISALAFPKIAEKSETGAPLNFGKKIFQLIILSIVIAGLYILFAPFIFELLFPQYIQAVPYSQVFSLSLIAIAANISFTAMQAQRKQKELYYINIGVPIFKITLMIIGIIYFGIWGAIVSKIFGHIVFLSASSYFTLKK